MLTNLKKIKTDITELHKVPTSFFMKLEDAEEFGDHLFPNWTREVFITTHLFDKFKVVYNKYKAIKELAEREKIIKAFMHTNQVEDLCNCKEGIEVIELTDLDHSIREEIDALFIYLYKTALNYQGFEKHVGKNRSESIYEYVYKTNKLSVCPFCGLESFLMIEGQSSLALDHWLCIDLFPFAAINFDNLIPIGDKCNARPAKGDTNILIDDRTTRNRIVAYYPFQENSGVITSFKYINEPSVESISDGDWQFDILPKQSSERNIFDSWNSIFNIEIRYKDYYRKNIFDLWEEDYVEWVSDEHQINHASSVEGFRDNLKTYRAGFQIKNRIGSILYRSFLNYLINEASEAHLFGLCKRFNE